MGGQKQYVLFSLGWPAMAPLGTKFTSLPAFAFTCAHSSYLAAPMSKQSCQLMQIKKEAQNMVTRWRLIWTAKLVLKWFLKQRFETKMKTLFIILFDLIGFVTVSGSWSIKIEPGVSLTVKFSFHAQGIPWRNWRFLYDESDKATTNNPTPESTMLCHKSWSHLKWTYICRNFRS